MMKRTLALLLSLAMAFALVPMSALAAEDGAKAKTLYDCLYDGKIDGDENNLSYSGLTVGSKDSLAENKLEATVAFSGSTYTVDIVSSSTPEEGGILPKTIANPIKLVFDFTGLEESAGLDVNGVKWEFLSQYGIVVSNNSSVDVNAPGLAYSGYVFALVEGFQSGSAQIEVMIPNGVKDGETVYVTRYINLSMRYKDPDAMKNVADLSKRYTGNVYSGSSLVAEAENGFDAVVSSEMHAEAYDDYKVSGDTIYINTSNAKGKTLTLYLVLKGSEMDRYLMVLSNPPFSADKLSSEPNSSAPDLAIFSMTFNLPEEAKFIPIYGKNGSENQVFYIVYGPAEEGEFPVWNTDWDGWRRLLSGTNYVPAGGGDDDMDEVKRAEIAATNEACSKVESAVSSMSDVATVVNGFASEAPASIATVGGVPAVLAGTPEAKKLAEAAKEAGLEVVTLTANGKEIVAPAVEIDVARMTRIPWTLVDRIAGQNLVLRLRNGGETTLVLGSMIAKTNASRVYYTIEDFEALFTVE